MTRTFRLIIPAAPLARLTVGDKVRMTVFREKQTRTIEIVLVQRPLLPGDVLGRYGTVQAGGAVPRKGREPVRRARMAFVP